MIELLCTDYNKKATSIHYYFGNAVLGQLMANHGWTWRTALCTCLMALTRFPSLTACLKLRRKPGRSLYFLSGRLLVFILGIILCFLVALTGKVSG